MSSPRSERFSEPPPSSQLPGRSSGTGAYVLGIVAFGALIVVLLLYWRGRAPETPPLAPAPPPTASGPMAESPVYAPPPPPEIEEPAADGAPPDAGKPSGGHATQPGVCEACGKGVSNATLEGRLKSQASLAKGCYNRALRTEDISGRLTVSVSVGADGRVCGAAVVNDTVGSASISNCVVSKFAGQTFPRPDQGCVVVNIPIEFKTK